MIFLEISGHYLHQGQHPLLSGSYLLQPQQHLAQRGLAQLAQRGSESWGLCIEGRVALCAGNVQALRESRKKKNDPSVLFLEV